MNSNYYKSTIKHSWLVMTTMAMIFSRPFVHATTIMHRHLRSTTNSNNVPIITSYNVNDGTSRKLQEEEEQQTTAASCLLITTGTGTYDGGYLDVYVNTGDGTYNMVTTPGINYDKGQIVLDECYANLVDVQVTNSQTNAWGGSIESSTDNKVTYTAMVCQDCTGDVSTTEYIVVDGDDNGTGDTKCLNGSAGNVCTLVNVVTTDEPTPEVSVSFIVHSS